MAEPQDSSVASRVAAVPAIRWIDLALAVTVGAGGGGLAAATGQVAPGRTIALGAVFGLICAIGIRGRALSAGGGLIWGLGTGFVYWIVLSFVATAFRFAGIAPVEGPGQAWTRFTELVACILCIGAPVGVALGIRGRRVEPPGARWHWGRAISAGGLAGLAAALIFSRWMYAGDFYPLISGLDPLGTHFRMVALHFAVACLIGCTFGALFQSEVRNLGSSMGWGIAYALFWWFLGPLTLFPLAAGRGVAWSAARAMPFFGPMVGHILYGLILGVVYAAFDAVWTRLFVDADPLNRKREGPGVHLLRSLAWGSAAGLAGGLVVLPLMVRTGVLAKLAGLDSGLSTTIGIGLHLVVSTFIGASYGFLFRGETFNAVFGSLWGFVVGLIWWYAGPLTLLPLLRTGECDWTSEAAGALLPSLIAHLLFGVVVANLFLAFERRAARNLRADSRLAELERGRAGVPFSPAPALAVFVLGVGVLLPILFA